MVYVFRHGQTFYNRAHVFTGFKDSKLTQKGIREARVIARKLRGKKLQVAFYTRLSRSRDTLKEVLKYHPECKRLIKDDRMIERSYGDLAGTYHSTVIRRFGQERYDTWHRGFGIRPPGGESFADVARRVRPFIKDLIKFVNRNRVDVAVSAHGNSIRLFRHITEGASVEKTCKWFIPYDKIFVYRVRGNSIKLKKVI